MNRSLSVRLLWLGVFGVAFGYMEATVVIYLRELYYPIGFAFPAVMPGTGILLVEVGRELATLLILLGVAMSAGRNPWDRFGIFCFLFGVWDLVYYVVLWGVLSWPESLLTWDVLFLVPLVWTGPVLSAVLVAASLTLAGPLIMKRIQDGIVPGTSLWIWMGSAASLAILLWSFMANHGLVRAEGIPTRFPWPPFLAATLLGWFVFWMAFYKRVRS